MSRYPHLRALPTSPQHPERIPPALLARATGRDDCRRTVAALMAALADKEEVVGQLQERLDEAGEALAAAQSDIAYWARRAVLAERAQRPALLAGWYALLALGWVDFWDAFETPESRAGVQR